MKFAFNRQAYPDSKIWEKKEITNSFNTILQEILQLSDAILNIIPSDYFMASLDYLLGESTAEFQT